MFYADQFSTFFFFFFLLTESSAVALKTGAKESYVDVRSPRRAARMFLIKVDFKILQRRILMNTDVFEYSKAKFKEAMYVRGLR